MSETMASPPHRRGVHVPVWVMIVAGAVLLGIVAFVVGRATRDGHRRFDGHFARGGHHPFALLLLIAVVALVVVGIVYAVRHFSARTRTTTQALEILEARLARGEIDEEEFRRRRAALTE
jgi:putative membrane protein